VLSREDAMEVTGIQIG